MVDDSNSYVNRRRFIKTAGAGVGIAAIAGCSNSGGSNGSSGGETTGSSSESSGGSSSGGDPIRIGALEPFSGPFSFMGNPHMSGLSFAVDEINADGGVLGRDLELVQSDTQSDPVKMVNSYTRLVEQEDIVAAAGPVNSPAAVRLRSQAERMEVPVFHHASGARNVLSKDSRYAFRTVLPPAHTSSYSLSRYLSNEGVEETGMIVLDDGWGATFGNTLPSYTPQNIDVTSASAPVTESNFTPYIREMPSDLDAMVATSHPPGIPNIFNQTFEVGLSPSLTTGAIDPASLYYNAIGDAVTKGFAAMTTVDFTTNSYKEVATRFTEDTGNYFDLPAAAGYVAGKLIASGLEESGSTDPSALADAMRNISFDTLLTQPIEYTDWGELKNIEVVWYGYELEAPNHAPENPFRLTEEFRTDPLPAFDPDTLELPESLSS